jgi:subtilisin family serine protease
MTHHRALIAATLALTLAACGQQTTGGTTAGTPANTDSSGAYLVGFKQEALSTQGLSAQAAVQAQAITAAGGVLTSQWADISAAAVRLTPAALTKLTANPLVDYVEQEAVHHALGGRNLTTDAGPSGKPGSATPSSTTTAPYTASGEYTWGDNALKVPQLQAAHYTGSGSAGNIAVCVLDTGIDGNHPEFKRGLKGFKNFTGEAQRDSAYALNDVSHHGTHVSGTIYAQYGIGTGASGLQPGENSYGVGGVATGADLYMGRVLGDSGSGSSSNIINGLNWCVSQAQGQGGTEAKVVVSMSLGGGRKSITEQRAYTSAYNKGVLIVAATGNDGAAVSYPAAYDNVVGVAAVDNTLARATFSNFGPQVDLSGPGVSVLSSVPLGAGEAATASGGGVTFNDVLAADLSGKTASAGVSGTIVRAGDGTGTSGANEFCGTSTRNSDLNGNIALIARGTCTFEEKAANAFGSGAQAVMIYNNTSGPLGMSLTNTYSIPVVGILQTDGQTLLGKLPTTGTVTVTAADYEYYDGTSMATPHVSAAAAVVWAAKPTLTNTGLINLLTSTAKDLGASGRDDNYGYGLVDPYKAITGP